MIFSFLIALPSFAGNGSININPDAGKTYFSFLRLGYDARSETMGGTRAGSPGNISGTVLNPAALGFVSNMQAMISYQSVILDVRAGALAFAKPLNSSFGVLAANIVYVSYGVLEPVDENNEKIDGTIHPYDIAGTISWANVFFDNFAVGATFKGIYSKLSNGLNDEIVECSADGFALDIGAQYKKDDSNITYGILIKNLGFVRSGYDGENCKNDMPLSFSAGFHYIFKNFPSVGLAFDLEKPVDDYLRYKMGFDIDLYKKAVFLRFGANMNQGDIEQIFNGMDKNSNDDDIEKLSWNIFSAGMGVKSTIKDLEINVDGGFHYRANGIEPLFIYNFIVGF